MNDPHEPVRDDARPDEAALQQPGFGEPGHDWVRDLLADARVTTPPPADVLARLDDTLAALQAEQQPPSSVVPLRRRVRPRLAVAAAAVIIAAAGGVLATQLHRGSSGSGSASSGAADSTSRTSSPGGRSGVGPQAFSGTAVPSLSTASFAADAAALMRTVASGRAQVSQDTAQALPSPTSASGGPPDTAGSTAEGLAGANDLRAPALTTTPQALATESRSPAGAECRGPSVPGAITLPATLDATRVALVFRAPTAAGQRVEAWSCDGSTMLAHATIGP